MSALKIKQVRSATGTNPSQKATLEALGLGRIGKAVERRTRRSCRARSASSRTWWRSTVAEKLTGTARSEEIGLHNLKPKPGSRRPRKRVGRGEGSGHGKTSGRGHKGYGSRAGAKSKAGYEGGQNPIHMRMRKLRGPHKRSRCRSRTSAPTPSRSTSPTSRSASTPAPR